MSSSHLGSAPFIWKPEDIKYLGIIIRTPINKIFEANGQGLLKKIKEDLRRWSALPLSLWGRVDILKMNVLPRLAHVISSIPLQFPQYWFKDVQSTFCTFLWKDKKPRLNFKKMSMLRSKGGLGVPDLYLYYSCC